MANIKDVARDLFRRLKQEMPEKAKVVNEWVIENSDFNNLPLFLAEASEDDKKRLCVMLKKALDSKDFGAFTGPAQKPEPESKDESEDPEEQEEEQEEEKPEPKPEPKETITPEPKEKATESTQSEPEPAAPAPSGGTLDSMVATIAGAVATKKIKGFIPKIVDMVIEKLGGKPKTESQGESLSEDRIREIVREEIKAHFNRVLNG